MRITSLHWRPAIDTDPSPHHAISLCNARNQEAHVKQSLIAPCSSSTDNTQTVQTCSRTRWCISKPTSLLVVSIKLNMHSHKRPTANLQGSKKHFQAALAPVKPHSKWACIPHAQVASNFDPQISVAASMGEAKRQAQSAPDIF